MSIYCYHKQKSVFLNSVSPSSSSLCPKESGSGPAALRVSGPLIRSPPSPPARWSLNGCKVLAP